MPWGPWPNTLFFLVHPSGTPAALRKRTCQRGLSMYYYYYVHSRVAKWQWDPRERTYGDEKAQWYYFGHTGNDETMGGGRNRVYSLNPTRVGTVGHERPPFG